MPSKDPLLRVVAGFKWLDLLLVALGVTVGTGGMFEVFVHPILPPMDMFVDVILGPITLAGCFKGIVSLGRFG